MTFDRPLAVRSPHAKIACLLAIIGLTLAAPSLAGDAEMARFLLKGAKTDIDKREYDAAFTKLVRASEEEPTLLEPLHWLGVVHEKRGEPGLAIAAYRRFLGQAEGRATAASNAKELATLVKKTRERLNALAPGGADLGKLESAFVSALLGFVKASGETDLATAGEALRLVLEVRPSDPTAQKLVGKLGGELPKGPPAPPAAADPPADAPSAAADRAGADVAAKRADKSLKARKWADAKADYERALQADAAHLAARFGLAEAALALGDRTRALEAFRQVASTSVAAGSGPPDWEALPAKAKQRATDLEATGATFAALVNRQVEGLLGLARRWVRDDPEVAVRAARALLRLKPGDERATALLDEAGAGDSGTWTAIFDGRDLSGFPGHDPEKVQLADGILVAEIKQAAFLTLAQKNFEGDYDLRMEMRIAKTHSPKYVAVMLAGHSAAYVYTQVGVWLDDAVLREVDGQGKEESRFPFRKPLSEITPKIDPSTWNTYELQFRDGRVRFLVNGNLLTEQERAANREAGRAGIQFQDVRMEIRRFQYRQR